MLFYHAIFPSQLTAQVCLIFGSEWLFMPPDCKTTRPLRRTVPLRTLFQGFFPVGVFPRLGMMLICSYRYVHLKTRSLGPLLFSLLLASFSLTFSSFLLGAPFQSPIRLASPVYALRSSVFTPEMSSTHMTSQGKSALPYYDG